MGTTKRRRTSQGPKRLDCIETTFGASGGRYWLPARHNVHVRRAPATLSLANTCAGRTRFDIWPNLTTWSRIRQNKNTTWLLRFFGFFILQVLIRSKLHVGISFLRKIPKIYARDKFIIRYFLLNFITRLPNLMTCCNWHVYWFWILPSVLSQVYRFIFFYSIK